MKTERGALLLSAAGALLVGCVGIVMWRVTGSDAILLDGLFNIIFFLTALFTVKVSRLVFQPDDEAYPFGYAYFEPLVNGLKGALILGVALLALFGSLAALATGGREIAAGAAIGYGVFATIVCGLLAFVLRRASARLSSPWSTPMQRTGWSTPPSPLSSRSPLWRSRSCRRSGSTPSFRMSTPALSPR